jgi:hypothetical protein
MLLLITSSMSWWARKPDTALFIEPPIITSSSRWYASVASRLIVLACGHLPLVFHFGFCALNAKTR